MAFTEAKNELVLWFEFGKPVSDTTQKRIAVWYIYVKE